MENLHGLKLLFAQVGPLSAAAFILPFAGLLLAIAVLPLKAGHFWESNRNKAFVAGGISLPVFIFLLTQEWQHLAAVLLDYGAFISLLSALFIISGGIYVRGSFAGLPWVNALFLFAGAVLSNLIGTTGASMLLIRPLLRANAERRHKAHIIIFFIFIVSNCSGLLTPLGDPPLFLGFLKGVDFAWTLKLFPQWLFVNSFLLALFFIFDSVYFRKEHQNVHEILKAHSGYVSERFGVEGGRNILFLLTAVAVILFSGYVIYPLSGNPVIGEPFGVFMSKVFQIFGMSAAAGASYFLTPKSIHKKNHFSFHPVIEVAVLFAGIFVTMVPALMILETQGGKLGVSSGLQYFWMTGLLSSFLDNAPTYLAFTSLAKGALGLSGEGLKGLLGHFPGEYYLSAISCGAVFMGANTYIGNGPNFMVKAVAEHGKIKMPGFFGYMVWSGGILMPLFILTGLFFFGKI